MEHTSCFRHATPSLTSFEALHPLCRAFSNSLLKQFFWQRDIMGIDRISEGIARLVDEGGFHWRIHMATGKIQMPGFSWTEIIFMCTFAMLKPDAFSSETELYETLGTTARISFVLEVPTRHFEEIKSMFILFFFFSWHELSFRHCPFK